MKGWDKGSISKLVSKYDTTSIGMAKFLRALKGAAIQYIKLEKSNTGIENNDYSQSREAFLRRMNSTIIQWRTNLAFVLGDTLVLSDAKVNEFVAMVEHARKIHWEGETDDTPICKQKLEEEETNSNYSPAFKREMQRVDDNMHRAPP
jgi:hypothetical protein